MKLYILTVITILLFSFGIFGQETPAPKPTGAGCTLMLKDAPVLHALQLGMERKTFDALFNPVKKVNGVPANEAGGQVVIKAADLKGVKNFEQVETVVARFYQDKFYRFAVTYDKTSAKWKDVSEFVGDVSAKFKLPQAGWKIVSGLPGQSQGFLICKEFNVYVKDTTILLTDLVAMGKMTNAAQK